MRICCCVEIWIISEHVRFRVGIAFTSRIARLVGSFKKGRKSEARPIDPQMPGAVFVFLSGEFIPMPNVGKPVLFHCILCQTLQKQYVCLYVCMSALQVCISASDCMSAWQVNKWEGPAFNMISTISLENNIYRWKSAKNRGCPREPKDLPGTPTDFFDFFSRKLFQLGRLWSKMVDCIGSVS